MTVTAEKCQTNNCEDLMRELESQNVSLSVVGENNLRVTGEMTPAQKTRVLLLKYQLIEKLIATRTEPKKDESLTEKLNRMFPGASAEVSVDDFQISGADGLTDSQKNFLTVNKISILCTLQQSLLVRHLFSDKPELREIFIEKIRESGGTSEAAACVTAKWFARLLGAMSDRQTERINL